MRPEQTRTYDRASSVVFLKTDAPFGGLSNMAGGFPLWVNGIRILTSEALYQACRFPHRPEVQTLIIEQKSPMTAKMKSKPYRHDSRPDWDQVRVKIMRWCLRVKLAQHWRVFSELLLETGERPIVEESRKDAFWGAKVTDDGTLVGMNVLGRLLMELREAVRVEARESLMSVHPLVIPDFLLGGCPIEIVTSQDPERDVESGPAVGAPARGGPQRPAVQQASLFDAPAVKEAHPAAYVAARTTSVHVADLKPYPEYKESGLPWLGRVPTHWPVLPNRALFAEVKDRDHPDEEMLSVTITRGIVRQKTLLEGSSKKDSSNLDKSAYKLIQPRDIAYNKMRAWQGAIGASALRGIISPAYVVMRLRNVDDFPSYFHHLYRTPQFAKEAERWSYGITSDMWSLRPQHFKMIYTPQPPPDEQAAIVRFLDWANGRLERAIRAKQKVIALLNEQKQAIIHRAVTRGLDPSVPLKPSGIPWLADIPRHWEIRRLKHCISPIEQGWSPQCDAQPADEDEWGVLKVGCVNKDAFSPKLNKRLPNLLQPDRSLEVRDGDILVSRANTRELLGLAALAESPPAKRILCDKLFRFRARAGSFDSKFLVLSLRAKPCREQIESSTNGASSSMQNIGQGVLKNLWVWMPSIAEQRRIVTHIAAATQPATATISRLEREIELLREYRTRLVADVVTGKLDVREAAARLHAETPLDSVVDDVDLDDESETDDEETTV